MEWTVWAQAKQSTQCLSIYFSRNHSGRPKTPSQELCRYCGPKKKTKNYTDVGWFMLPDVELQQLQIKSWLFRATLTWQFLRCSGGRRRQSSGWLPPNWSRPPPQSDRSPGSWGRQLRDKFRIYSNSSTVASVHRLYTWAHTKPNSIYKSSFLAAGTTCGCQHLERQVGHWSIGSRK